jgi:hypothetical protein
MSLLFLSETLRRPPKRVDDEVVVRDRGVPCVLTLLVLELTLPDSLARSRVMRATVDDVEAVMAGAADARVVRAEARGCFVVAMLGVTIVEDYVEVRLKLKCTVEVKSGNVCLGLAVSSWRGIGRGHSVTRVATVLFVLGQGSGTNLYPPNNPCCHEIHPVREAGECGKKKQQKQTATT